MIAYRLTRLVRRLAKNDITDEASRSLFIKRLPETTRGILAGSEESLEKIGERADKIQIYVPSTSSSIAEITKPSVAAISQPAVESTNSLLQTLTNQLAQLMSSEQAREACLARLESELSLIQVYGMQRSQSPYQSQSRERSPSGNRDQSSSKP